MQKTDEVFAIVAVTALLILTAWGSAKAMFIFSIIGLVVGIFLFKGKMRQGVALVVTVSFVVAAVIALVIVLGFDR